MSCLPWLIQDVITFSALISSCEKAKHWQLALCFLTAMEVAQLQPSVVSYTAAMSACQGAQHWHHTAALFDAMGRRTVQPNAISFSAIVASCEAGWRWQPLPKVLEDLTMAWQNLTLLTCSESEKLWLEGGTNIGQEWCYNCEQVEQGLILIKRKVVAGTRAKFHFFQMQY